LGTAQSKNAGHESLFDITKINKKKDRSLISRDPKARKNEDNNNGFFPNENYRKRSFWIGQIM
jgi:hypothetical protein